MSRRVLAGSPDLGPVSTDAGAGPSELPANLSVRPPDTIADKYRLESLVAVGGMGAVFRARHLQLGQDVAIKVLRPDVADRDKAIPRFLREARAAAGIRSEHVARTYDVDTLPDGTPYMVMELLEGRDLRALGRELVQFPVEQALDIAVQVCDALSDAHAMGIVHRDLKPSNLFVTERRDGRHLVKLVDFGISKATDAAGSTEVTLTEHKAIVGSPAYMSPEQVRDSRRADQRSDIWSLGVILYQMLCGSSPFRRENVATTLAAVLAEPVIPLRELRPDVDAALDAIVMRCLAKDPELRFQTADALREALRSSRAAPGEPAGPLPGATEPLFPKRLEAGAGSAPLGGSDGDPLLGSRQADAESPTVLAVPGALPAGAQSNEAPGVPSVASEVVREIEAEVSAELGRLGVIGEVRADTFEVGLLGAGVRAPLGTLGREWPSLTPSARAAASRGLAQRIARDQSSRAAPRAGTESGTAWTTWVIGVVLLAALGYGALSWLMGAR